MSVAFRDEFRKNAGYRLAFIDIAEVVEDGQSMRSILAKSARGGVLGPLGLRCKNCGLAARWQLVCGWIGQIRWS